MTATCKTCTHCHQPKPLSAFSPRKGRLRGPGVHSTCKECRRVLNREAYRRSRAALPVVEAGWVAPTDFLWPGPVEPVALVWRIAA